METVTMGTARRTIQRVILVSEKDIQCGINGDGFFGFSFMGLLPISAKLNIHQLEVNTDSLETRIIALTGVIMVRSERYTGYIGSYSSLLPIRIYMEVDNETVQMAMVEQDIIPILRNTKQVKVVSIVPIEEQIEEEDEDDNTYRMVTKMLLSAGIKISLRGFSYLRVAICNALTKEKTWGVLCNEIYPIVADKYNTDARSVEKCIRYAISLAYTSRNKSYVPTNMEFISMIVEKIQEIWSKKYGKCGGILT